MTESVAGQVRAAELEARFSILVTLAVCVRVEWANGPNGVAMAVVLPVAMAFSVHGLHNASGLGAWNLVYVPLRLVVVVAGLAYSYSHYLAMLGDRLEIAGWDIRWLVAVIVELLTVSALVAHQAHTARLHTISGGPVEDGDVQQLEGPADEGVVPGRGPAVWPAGLARQAVDAGTGVPLVVHRQEPLALNGSGAGTNNSTRS